HPPDNRQRRRAKLKRAVVRPGRRFQRADAGIDDHQAIGDKSGQASGDPRQAVALGQEVPGDHVGQQQKQAPGQRASHARFSVSPGHDCGTGHGLVHPLRRRATPCPAENPGAGLLPPCRGRLRSHRVVRWLQRPVTQIAQRHEARRNSCALGPACHRNPGRSDRVQCLSDQYRQKPDPGRHRRRAVHR
nr:hypothetical protein [Tanacetum cinerariifolium]